MSAASCCCSARRCSASCCSACHDLTRCQRLATREHARCPRHLSHRSQAREAGTRQGVGVHRGKHVLQRRNIRGVGVALHRAARHRVVQLMRHEVHRRRHRCCAALAHTTSSVQQSRVSSPQRPPQPGGTMHACLATYFAHRNTRPHRRTQRAAGSFARPCARGRLLALPFFDAGGAQRRKRRERGPHAACNLSRERGALDCRSSTYLSHLDRSCFNRTHPNFSFARWLNLNSRTFPASIN